MMLVSNLISASYHADLGSQNELVGARSFVALHRSVSVSVSFDVWNRGVIGARRGVGIEAALRVLNAAVFISVTAIFTF